MAKEPKVTEEKEIIDGDNQESAQTTSGAASSPSKEEVVTAKAGKRSAKAIKEAEEAAAKEARKAETATTEAPAAKPQPKTRSKLERRGKNYRKANEAVEAGKQYSLDEATKLVAKTSPVKFDASVELHVRLNVDPRQADQNIRQTVVLPNGTGKTVRVAVFAEPDQHADAKKAGADIVAGDEFLQQLDKEELNFDVLIATPSLMAKLGKYARVLGPKGLMPNPKSGTVTKTVGKAVEEAKAGRVEYRVDSTGIIHLSIGKVSFEPAKLLENAEAVMGSIRAAKPASVKGNYIVSLYLTSSMGPSISLSI